MGLLRSPALVTVILVSTHIRVVEAQTCAEPAVQDICNCGSHSMWAGSKCNDCKDKQFWGYGCDIPCDMAKCPLGCDFIGRCYNPHIANCEHMVRIDDGTGSEMLVNDRGECQSCKDGKYWGLLCEHTCGPKSGLHCKKSAEGYCSRSGSCYSCELGWYGENCTQECPAACQDCVMKDGMVKLDDDDYMPAGSCMGHCKGNKWGLDCTNDCSATCKSFPPEHKFGNRATCQKNDGHCLMCGGSLLLPLIPYNRVNLTGKFMTAGAKSVMKNGGNYYYELQLHFGPEGRHFFNRESVEVGWATQDFELKNDLGYGWDGTDNGLGSSKHAWATDGSKNATYLEGEQNAAHWPRRWHEGDIIGMAISIGEKTTMRVALNGVWINNWDIPHVKGDSYYPAISAKGPYHMSIAASTWRYAPPGEDYQEWAAVDYFNRPDRAITKSCEENPPVVGDRVVFNGDTIDQDGFTLDNSEIATVVSIVNHKNLQIKNTKGQTSPGSGWGFKHFNFVDHEDHRWWGPFCEHSCPEGCKGGMCDRDTGACRDGCEKGFYGLPNCTSTCGTHCEGGDCFDTGANAGDCRIFNGGKAYIGPCEPGYWGTDCNLPCPEGTLDVCDQLTGKPAACKGNMYPELVVEQDGPGIYKVVSDSSVLVHSSWDPSSSTYPQKLTSGAKINVTGSEVTAGVAMLQYVRIFSGDGPYKTGDADYETWVAMSDGNGKALLAKEPFAECVSCPADCHEKETVTDHATVLSDGTQSKPHCSWSRKCNWEEDKHSCAQALCEASGYDTGAFVEEGSSRDMCRYQYTYRTRSRHFYIADRGMIASGAYAKNARIKAECTTTLGTHCGDGAPLYALLANECPADLTNIPACDTVLEGAICQDDAKKCGTSDDLNNCGTMSLYRKAPQCSDDYPLIPVKAEHCPTTHVLANLKGCHAVAPGELCEGDGECGTNEELNNCMYTSYGKKYSYDIYRKARVKHSKATCDVKGRCIHGCVKGSFGEKCDTPCPQNCDSQGCDVKFAGALEEGWCKACIPWTPGASIKSGWAGPKCMHQCHHSCVECENWASPDDAHYRAWPKEDDYKHCTVCREDEPTKQRPGGTPGMCECIAGAKFNTTSERCECIPPDDSDVREAHFEVFPNKQCRHVCKNHGPIKYVEVFGDKKSRCITREKEKFIQRTMWTKPECVSDGCADHECKFACEDEDGNSIENVCTDPEMDKGYFCMLKEYVDFITG